jgi:P4 family phage/plasmid primase-like protien
MQPQTDTANAITNEVLDTARHYLASGFSVIPIKLDGSKAPQGALLAHEYDNDGSYKYTWTPYTTRYADEAELTRWFSKPRGIGLVCGQISGSFEVLDNDKPDVWVKWCDAVSKRAPGLLERLAIVQTPSDGHHVYYRCASIGRNEKLAERPIVNGQGKTTLSPIWETRGEGGYVVSPGSPVNVHKAGKPYTFTQGSLDTIPTITEAERAILFDVSRSFDEKPAQAPDTGETQAIDDAPDPATTTAQAATQTEGEKPGVDFNRRGDGLDILKRHGWIVAAKRGAGYYLAKPGHKGPGHHASYGIAAPRTLYVFSTNAAPFTHKKGYSPFQVLTLLDHNGDFRGAAKALAKQGYGKPRLDANGKPEKDEIYPPTHDELRDRWLGISPQTIFARDDFYQYSNGLWRLREEHVIKHMMQEIIELAKWEKINPTSGLLESVYRISKARCAKPSEIFDSQHDYLVCRNGTLNIKTRQLTGHSPKYLATSGVNYDYDPKATAPTWMMFLEWLETEFDRQRAAPKRRGKAGHELIEFLQEFVGYCITTMTNHEKSLWFQGEPGCGKSTFIFGVKGALNDRTMNLGLGDIERSRFALTHLPGKTLAVATEQPSDFLRCTDILIRLISGEPVTVERKFHHPFDIIPLIKLLWAMNDPPRVGNPNSGLFRRIDIIKWPSLNKAEQLVKVNNGVPMLIDAASLQDNDLRKDDAVKAQIMREPAGILNWSLDGLARLLARGHFVTPLEVRQASREFQESNDTPACFLAECCEVDTTGSSNYRTQSHTLYLAYKDWMLETGHKPKSETAIAEDWRRLDLEKKPISGKVYWYGVKLCGAPTTAP